MSEAEPIKPTQPTQATQESGSPSEEAQNYWAKTLRSAVFVVGFVLFVLASYGQIRLLLPLAGGFALSTVLFGVWEKSIRTLFTPERLRKKVGKAPQKPTTILLGIGLVKYPLVGLLLWWLVRIWNAEQMMAFVSGFTLLHIVIGLRALGRWLTTSSRRSH
jgi:hypothetical protein